MDLAEANGRLARWRLRLLEFDFKVFYRKGIKNTIADAISRLPTWGYLNVEPDLEIPCFMIWGRSIAQLLQVQTHIDSSSWCKNDWDPDSDFDRRPEVLAVDTTPDVEQISPLTVEELQRAQEADPLCQQARSDIDSNRHTPYIEDERGLIVRIASIDDAVQILCPVALRQKSFYWPTMLADIRRGSNDCHQCARERTKLRNHAAPMQLFPASSPLEFVAIDILGPLTESTKGHKFILVMTDRFSKMVRAVPLRSISALTVAKVFVRDWVFVYGPPAKLLSDNGKQFTAKLFQSVCRSLRV
eukprot:IDg21926t1